MPLPMDIGLVSNLLGTPVSHDDHVFVANLAESARRLERLGEMSPATLTYGHPDPDHRIGGLVQGWPLTDAKADPVRIVIGVLPAGEGTAEIRTVATVTGHIGTGEMTGNESARRRVERQRWLDVRHIPDAPVTGLIVRWGRGAIWFTRRAEYLFGDMGLQGPAGAGFDEIADRLDTVPAGHWTNWSDVATAVGCPPQTEPSVRAVALGLTHQPSHRVRDTPDGSGPGSG